MGKLFFTLCLLFLAAFGQAQKVINDPNAEARKLTGSFEGISVSGGIDLYLSQGDEAVAVSASKPEHRDRIKTEIQNGILKIWYDSKTGINITVTGERKLKAYVSYKTLNNLNASGGSDVLVDGTIKSTDFKLHVSGGSDFKGKVEMNSLDVDQSGGSDIHIAGKVGKLAIDASGGSDFNGYDLSADVCEIEASGGSDIEITANRELSARASGASDVRYKGNPTIKEAKVSGGGSVKVKSLP